MCGEREERRGKVTSLKGGGQEVEYRGGAAGMGRVRKRAGEEKRPGVTSEQQRSVDFFFFFSLLCLRVVVRLGLEVVSGSQARGLAGQGERSGG